MRQVWITRKGGPEVLEVREAQDPTPKEGEVRIRVRAAGVNFADVMARLGFYRDAPPLPCVVGYEVSGTVDAVGPGVNVRPEQYGLRAELLHDGQHLLHLVLLVAVVGRHRVERTRRHLERPSALLRPSGHRGRSRR